MDPAEVLKIDERRQIIDALYAMTDEDRATWRGRPGTDELSLRMGSHMYKLYPKDHDGVAPFVLEIHKNDGTVLAEIASRPRERAEYDAQINSQLEAIYHMAYRQVNRPEESVKQLLSEIRDIREGREPPF